MCSLLTIFIFISHESNCSGKMFFQSQHCWNRLKSVKMRPIKLTISCQGLGYTLTAVSEPVLLVTSTLDVGEICRCEDLSSFDTGQIKIVRWLGEKNDKLVAGCWVRLMNVCLLQTDRRATLAHKSWKWTLEEWRKAAHPDESCFIWTALRCETTWGGNDEMMKVSTESKLLGTNAKQKKSYF